MKKEEFTALGISEDLAAKAEEASLKELEDYAPKEKLEAAEAEKKQLQSAVSARDKQLEELKNASGDNEALQKQIKELQAANKAETEKHQGELKELRLTNAIKLAVAGKVHDEDMAAALFDRTKLVLTEEGKVAGLDEQLKAIRESKSFLFKENADTGSGAGTGGRGGYKPKGGEPHNEGYGAQYAQQRNEAEKSAAKSSLWGTE